MPVYEYRCRTCGHQFEVQQSFTDDPLSTCDACGGDLRKVFAPVGISFKGAGFYKTDSRGSSSKAPSSADKAPSASSSGSEGSNGSSSPATTGSGTSNSGTSNSGTSSTPSS